MPLSFPLCKLIRCSFIDPISDRKALFCSDGGILLKQNSSGDYKISAVGSFLDVSSSCARKGSVEFIDYRGFLAIPSFFDMHFHWVQNDVREAPKEHLLNWLQDYTWPAEAKYKNKAFAKKKAKEFAKNLLACGTLGGGCYASLHEHSVDYAFEMFTGDFVIGNVLMTMNSPDYLIHTQKQALAGIKKLHKRYGDKYALTPRFAPTTHPELMKQGGDIIRRSKGFIQSHLCETKQEIEYVLDIYHQIKGFEKVKNYTEIYEKCDLLGPRTIMGHGIYLSPTEWKVLSKSKTIVAHCPTSNAPLRQKGLGSGLFDFTKANKYKVAWALGSDIGAGPHLSMLDVMQSFVQQNKQNNAQYIQALYRSTALSAQLLGPRKSGRICPKYDANLVMLPMGKRIVKSAEDALRAILHSRRSKRSEYDNLVEKTIYNGIEVFSKY